MTTADYLTQLVKDTNQLKANLVEMGAEITEEDNLTTCVPKVLGLVSDLSTEEYMTLVDMSIDYMYNPVFPVYTEDEINKVDNYIKYYGGELNG